MSKRYLLRSEYKGHIAIALIDTFVRRFPKPFNPDHAVGGFTTVLAGDKATQSRSRSVIRQGAL